MTMMHMVPELSDRELEALERARQKAELTAWLRAEAAARDGEMAWYVARTNWRADAVAEDLRRSGIEAVCPKERRWKRYPRSSRRYSVDIPLFGNYLFVRLLKAESAWVGVLTFDGVHCLQGRGETPIPVREAEMIKILGLIGKSVDRTGGEATGLKVGDAVVHPVGSFAELISWVVSIDPVKREAIVSTMLFGREMETRCRIDDLERLS